MTDKTKKSFRANAWLAGIFTALFAPIILLPGLILALLAGCFVKVRKPQTYAKTENKLWTIYENIMRKEDPLP